MSARVEERKPLELDGPPLRHYAVPSSLLYAEDSRFDATSYASGATGARNALQACPCPKKTIGELCGTIWHPVQNQARSNFKRNYTKPEYGIPFVGSREMFFFPLRPEKFLSRRMEKLNDLMVPQGWVVLSRSGTVGNVLLVNEKLSKCAITEHAIRIQPVEVPSGYLYAVLASKFGQASIAKGIFGSTVDEIEPKHIAEIPVPLPHSSMQDAIDEKIQRAYALRDRANALAEEAEQTLHKLLGVTPFTDDDIEYLGSKDDPRAFVGKSSNLGDRFDATRHVPVAESAVHKLSAGNFKLVPLHKVVSKVYVAPRFARIYVEGEYGTPLLQGSQLPLMRPYGIKCISNTQTIKMDRWIIRAGWVLVTCSGTLGRVAVATRAQDGWAASQHILRIMPEAGISSAGFLAAFLTSPFGQHQLKAKSYGGVVEELTAEDTAEIYVPDVPYEKQKAIGDVIERVYEMRDEANEIESQAIREFEQFVERGASLTLVPRR